MEPAKLGNKRSSRPKNTEDVWLEKWEKQQAKPLVLLIGCVSFSLLIIRKLKKIALIKWEASSVAWAVLFRQVNRQRLKDGSFSYLVDAKQCKLTAVAVGLWQFTAWALCSNTMSSTFANKSKAWSWSTAWSDSERQFRVSSMARTHRVLCWSGIACGSFRFWQALSKPLPTTELVSDRTTWSFLGVSR